MGYLLVLLCIILTEIGTVCRKSYIRRTYHIRSGLDVFMLLCHPVAAMYFLFLSGGSILLNLPSFFFAVAYASVCLASVWASMLALGRINLVYISVFSGAGGAVIPYLFDLLIQGIPFAPARFLSILVRLVAVVFPLLYNKGQEKGLGLCMILFAVSGFAGVIPKMYSGYPGVVSDNSFFFWTNVLIVPIVAWMVLHKHGLRQTVADIKKIPATCYGWILLATATANLGSILSLQALRHMDASVYAVFSGSLGMLATVAVSTLIYKETLTKQSAVGVACSILAVILSVL